MPQIKNLKSRITKAERGDCGGSNFSDHVMEIASLITEGDNFIQFSIHENNKDPSVLLYTKDIIELVRQCCYVGTNRQILGVDRTFNLRDVYVTVACFKHLRLRRKVSMEEPVLFSPILLHGSCTHDIYGHLFSKIATTYSAEEITALTIGSDDEIALRKAIREVCLEPTTFCVRVTLRTT